MGRPRLYTEEEAKKRNRESRMRTYRRQQAERVERLEENHHPSIFASSVACFPGGFKAMWPFFVVAAMRNPGFQPLVDAAKSDNEWEVVKVTPEQFEKISINLSIPLSEFFGAAVAVVYEQRRDMTWLRVALAMPEVIDRNIKEAKTKDGIDDRQMFMKVARILPTPSTAVNIANVMGGPSITTGGEPSGLPSFESDTLTLSEVVRQVDALPVPALPEPVEVTPTEDSDV